MFKLMPKLNQKGVVHLFVPIILLLGLVAGVYLITSGNPLKLFSKASNNPIIFVLPDGSKCNPATTTCRIATSSATVRVELTSTLGAPMGVPATTARTSVLGVSEQISSLNQTINLSAGWDSIGLTVSKANSKANYKAEDLLVEFNTQLSSSGSRATQIVRWNSGRQEFHTLGQQANNFNIIPGEGYQIRTTKGGGVTISGDQATVSSISVNQGYASFSLPTVPDNMKTAEDLLQEMKKQGITANLISRWKDGRWNSHVINFPANNYQIEPGKGYLIRNTGAAKTFNIPASTSTPSPIPSSSPVPSATTTPIGTRYYKIAENPTDLTSATWQIYDQEPKVVDYTFKDTAPGAKFIWVEFKASDDRTDRRSAQLELVAPTSTPAPTPSPTSGPITSPPPTPRPIITPTPTASPGGWVGGSWFNISSSRSSTLTCRKGVDCSYSTLLTYTNRTQSFIKTYDFSTTSTNSVMKFRGFDGYMTTYSRGSSRLRPGDTSAVYVEVSIPGTLTRNIAVPTTWTGTMDLGASCDLSVSSCNNYPSSVWTLNINITN